MAGQFDKGLPNLMRSFGNWMFQALDHCDVNLRLLLLELNCERQSSQPAAQNDELFVHIVW